MTVLTDIEPTAEDLDDVVRHLETSWRATITVRRQSEEDVGYHPRHDAGPVYLTLERELRG